MKYIYFLFFFISASGVSQNKINPIVEVKYVGPGINTIISVDYTKFDSAFHKSMYKTTNITDSLFFNKLIRGYKVAKYKKRYKRIDTRYKITIYPPNETKPVLIYTNYYGDAVIKGKVLLKCDLLKTLHYFIEEFYNKKE